MTPTGIPFKADDGSQIYLQITKTDQVGYNGQPLYMINVDTELVVGDLTIGNVKLQDGVGATLATVRSAASGAAESDKALVVQAPVLGITTDAAITTNAGGTISGKLRGLIAILADIWNSTVHAFGVEGKGTAGTRAGGVLTVQGDPSGTPVPITLAEDTELGAVKLLDSAGTNEAQIAAVSAIAESGSTKLATHDPTIGITTGAAVITDAAGTVQQYLRGLVKLVAANINVVIAAGTAAIGGVTSLGYDASVVNTLGIGGARFISADQSAAPAAVTDAPGSTKKLVVTDLIVSLATALTVTLTEETSGTVLFSLVLPTGSFVIPLRGKLKLATNNKRLMVQTSLLGSISVSAIWYAE